MVPNILTAVMFVTGRVFQSSLPGAIAPASLTFTITTLLQVRASLC